MAGKGQPLETSVVAGVADEVAVGVVDEVAVGVVDEVAVGVVAVWSDLAESD